MDIYDFISKDSVRFANHQIERIREVTQRLKAFPLSGRVVPEIGDANYREILFGSYRIIYKLVSKKRIDILAVHHSARNLE